MTLSTPDPKSDAKKKKIFFEGHEVRDITITFDQEGYNTEDLDFNPGSTTLKVKDGHDKLDATICISMDKDGSVAALNSENFRKTELEYLEDTWTLGLDSIYEESIHIRLHDSFLHIRWVSFDTKTHDTELLCEKIISTKHIGCINTNEWN